ncbi:MAG: hypothetical protein ACRDY7_03805 [Acidimicrobiia bacterium]
MVRTQAHTTRPATLYHCDRADYEANLQLRERHGILELFESPQPDQKEIDEQLRKEAGEYLPGHLSQLLSEHGMVRPIAAVEDVYGDMLGRARSTHVRAALRQLHLAGSVDDDARDDFWLRSIRWTGPKFQSSR